MLNVAVDPELMPVLWLFPTTSPFLQHSRKKSEEGDAWEYAPLYGWKFHLQQRSNDVFRRRCWRRRLTPSGTDHLVAPIFLLEGSLVRVGRLPRTPSSLDAPWLSAQLSAFQKTLWLAPCWTGREMVSNGSKLISRGGLAGLCDASEGWK